MGGFASLGDVLSGKKKPKKDAPAINIRGTKIYGNESGDKKKKDRKFWD